MMHFTNGQNASGRPSDFFRIPKASVLSGLYPKESEVKRLLDAMLLAVPR